MSNNIIPISNSQPSALQQSRMQSGKAVNKNFADGIRDAFPLLSIKGKVFRARISGEETMFVDPNTRAALPFLDVVLVNASSQLSKAYYEKGFVEGDFDPPLCWSLDSFKPDPSVAQKQSPLCQSCPKNQFGSKITDNGKKAKACQDARRVAVVMPHQLQEDAQLMMLLRVPQSSLKNLKAYAQLLERHGYEPMGCRTRIQFDNDVAFPKMLFNFVAPLDDQEFAKVIELSESESTAAMLLAPDFDDSTTVPPQENASEAAMSGLAPQQPPVIVQPPTAQVVQMPVQAQAPVHQMPIQQAPVQEAQADHIITLPTGQRYNVTKGVYLEAEPEEAQAKMLNPDVITLPDGKFFNPHTTKYVTGPYIGDPDVTDVQVEVKKPAKKAAPKKEAAPKEQAPAQEPVQQAAAPVDKPATNGAAQQKAHTVAAAPAALESILGKLVPPQGS